MNEKLLSQLQQLQLRLDEQYESESALIVKDAIEEIQRLDQLSRMRIPIPRYRSLLRDKN